MDLTTSEHKVARRTALTSRSERQFGVLWGCRERLAWGHGRRSRCHAAMRSDLAEVCRHAELPEDPVAHGGLFDERDQA